jgi:N-acetylglucosaminyldiphosphoundecaprenol N-acetyl-beta-D-mannosaminyltransferase
MSQKQFDQIKILGVRVDIICKDDIIRFIFDTIRNDTQAILAYANVHAINIAYDDIDFRNSINNSDIIFCDGFGVKWAAYLLFKKVLYRVSPPDWFDDLLKESAQNGHSMFLLGTCQEIIENTANIMVSRFPELIIAGVHHGFFTKTQDDKDNTEVLDMINKCQPDILVVGFGMPTQEKWIQENRQRLNTHLIIPVGAYFDYFTGDVKRAPQWMTDRGLEWLGRLIIEPNRLWKRYLVGNPLFLWRLFKHNILRIPLPFPSTVKKQ